MGKFTEMSEALYPYFTSMTMQETDVMKQCREETSGMELARMQISPEQGGLLTLLTSLVSDSKGTNISAIEVGTFTGYSALCIARGLATGQKMLTCDLDEETLRIARRHFSNADLGSTIDVASAPAAATLSELKNSGAMDVDFMFIDADKTNYDLYYELGLTLVRPGGLIAIDNVFWGGDVVDPSNKEEDTEAIRALNEKIANDSRVFSSMVPIADGLTLCRKL